MRDMFRKEKGVPAEHGAEARRETNENCEKLLYFDYFVERWDRMFIYKQPISYIKNLKARRTRSNFAPSTGEGLW